MNKKMIGAAIIVGSVSVGLISSHPSQEGDVENIQTVSTVQESPYAGVSLYTNDLIKELNERFTSEDSDVTEVSESKPFESQALSVEKFDINGVALHKTWMSYTAITNTSSAQYKLQQMAYTGDYGIRMVEDRYCVAIGTGYGVEIGQWVDIVLEDYETIPAIVSDIKALKDAPDGQITTHSSCASEFVIDLSELDEDAKYQGDMSAIPGWEKRAIQIVVYDKNSLSN